MMMTEEEKEEEEGHVNLLFSEKPKFLSFIRKLYCPFFKRSPLE